MWNMYCFFLLLLKRSGSISQLASLLLMESPLCVLAIELRKKYFFDIFCFCVSERTHFFPLPGGKKILQSSFIFHLSSPLLLLLLKKWMICLLLKYSWTSFYTFSQHEIKQFPRFCNVFFLFCVYRSHFSSKD